MVAQADGEACVSFFREVVWYKCLVGGRVGGIVDRLFVVVIWIVKGVWIVLDVGRIREDFPILQREFEYKGRRVPLVYLDNAATTQKPRVVIDALRRYYEWYNANIHRALHRLGEEATVCYEESRRRVAEFISARSASEVVFTKGATEAINLVARSWGEKFLRRGDEILLTEMEHHSNLVPWQMLARRCGVKLRFLPFRLEDCQLDLDQWDRVFTDRVKLVSVVHVSNLFGCINPVREIISWSHERGVPVLLDGAQSVPHMGVDVQELGCDFLVFSGHKMCGPTGVGVLYGREERLEEMDPYEGGGEMIERVEWESATYAPLPHKFEAGTPPIAGAIGLGEAVKYLEGLGMEAIERYEKKLVKYALDKLLEFDRIKVYGPLGERSGLISFTLEGVHPHDVAQFLDREGVAVRAGHHCVQPAVRKLGIAATTRVSFYFYNTLEEIDLFLEALRKAKEFFDGF